MRCIRCNTDNKKKTRQLTGKCSKCGEPFAFEPTTDPLKITDQRFLRAIQRASGMGRGVYFTERQLRYVLDSALPRPNATRFFFGLAMVFALTFLLSAALRTNFVLTGVGVLIVWLVGKRLWFRLLGSVWPALDPARVQNREMRASVDIGEYVRRWERAHGPIEKLLRRPEGGWAEAGRASAADLREPDVTVYSFDRAIVTDQAETAAMLVANNFHFENDCAILSYDGYPGAMAPTILGMLRRNPRLQVFSLHDASPDGCLLPLKLREARWFPDRQVRILDLGLRPKHAIDLGLILQSRGAQPVDPRLAEVLTESERQWLARGNRAELAAIQPARLLRGIYQGMARARQAEAPMTTQPAPEPASAAHWPLVAGAAAMLASFLGLFAFLRHSEASDSPATAFDEAMMLTEEERRRRAAGQGGGELGINIGDGDHDEESREFGFDWSDQSGADVFAADSFG